MHEYHAVMERLYALGWDDELDFEDYLPHELMPEEYLRRNDILNGYNFFDNYLDSFKQEMNEYKVRHGCLTKWLIFAMMVNLGITLIFLINYSTLKVLSPTAPSWIFPLLPISSILNVVFLIALFRWKKWGFWGLIGTTIVLIPINLMLGTGIIQSFQGLLALAILFGLLQIGKENKGWSQLE